MNGLSMISLQCWGQLDLLHYLHAVSSIEMGWNRGAKMQRAASTRVYLWGLRFYRCAAIGQESVSLLKRSGFLYK